MTPVMVRRCFTKTFMKREMEHKYDLPDWMAKAICNCDFVVTNTHAASMFKRARVFITCHHEGITRQLEHALEREVILILRR